MGRKSLNVEETVLNSPKNTIFSIFWLIFAIGGANGLSEKFKEVRSSVSGTNWKNSHS